MPIASCGRTRKINAPSRLELELYADWHGDGAKQNDEPSIKDAILELSAEGRTFFSP
jgi:hypothetical protein